MQWFTIKFIFNTYIIHYTGQYVIEYIHSISLLLGIGITERPESLCQDNGTDLWNTVLSRIIRDVWSPYLIDNNELKYAEMRILE